MMKKIVRLGTTLLHETSRHGFDSNFYCTKAMPSRRSTRPLEGSTTELYRRISPVGNPNISIVPILNQWIEEGRSVDKESLILIMKKLLHFDRFSHALEISLWMTDKRYFELTSTDVSLRLLLISKDKGINEAEKYFKSISQKLKRSCVYGTLLKCYASALCVEMAEAVMQNIRNLGYPNHIENYNVMLKLYRKTGNMEKFNALLQEMEENGMASTNAATLCIQLNAYADVKDIEGMDKIVRILESDPNVVPDWSNYCAAATGYIKAGLFDKALEMLKKVEARVITNRDFDAYDQLLTQYGTLGRKDEVFRVWSLYKQKCKVYNNGYKHVLDTLVKLGDIEMAEEIFGEWESQGLTYDMNIPTIMIGAYSRKGLIGKAEALLDKAMSKGGKPYAATWRHLVEGYLLNEQYQKAIETMKKLITNSVTRRKPVPTVASVIACLEYLKRAGDTEQTKEFIKLLVDNDVISLDQLEELSKEKVE